MGLFDMNRPRGLFGADPGTQDAINSYAAMPRGKQGKGGLFGSGYDGEDILNMLLRAAAIAQGEYGAGAEFGANIGARARAAAAEAAKRQQERDDYVWKKETDQRFEKPDTPEMIAKLNAWNAMTPEQKRQFAQMQDVVSPSYTMIGGSQYRIPREVGGEDAAPDILPPNVVSGIMGGGSGDATGGFRFNIPRIRP